MQHLAFLWTGEQTVTFRLPRLFTKREPNLLFSVLPFISLSHPVFWPHTILFVASPPSASVPWMTPSRFPAFLFPAWVFLFLSLSVCHVFIPPKKKILKPSLKILAEIRKNLLLLACVLLKWSILVNFVTKTMQYLRRCLEEYFLQAVSIQWKPIWCSVTTSKNTSKTLAF